jgi:hypothetical protein
MTQDVAVIFSIHVMEVFLFCGKEVSLLKKAGKGLGMVGIGVANHPIHIKNDCFGHNTNRLIGKQEKVNFC